MKEHEIKELVEQMEQGIQKAYESMYNETSKGVFFICMSFLHNEEDAKDAMQETYLTAYRKISQLKEKEKFVSWLNQIAINKCKESLRQNAPVLVDAEDLENVIQEDNENFLPEEYITNKEKRKIVMDIMRKSLSDIQYRTVILYYFNRLTVEEIADIMECPPGTVKYRLSVARAKIRDGVVVYEKDTKDKLYSFAAVPLLVSLFAMEVEAMVVPDSVWKNIKTRMDFANSKIKNDENTSEKLMKTEGMEKMAKKTGFWFGKGKIAVITIATVALIGAGVGIAIGINKGNENVETTGNGTVTVENNQTNEINDGSDENAQNENGEELDVQEEIVLHPAFDEQIRWMTSHNFSDGQLENAPEGVILFPNTSKPLTLPISYESFTVPADKSGTILEPGKSMNVRVDDFEHFVLNVRNMSDSEMAVDECLANGWASITADGYGHPSGDEYFAEMFGYSAELSDTNAYLDMLVETYGSPSYVDIFMTSDSVTEGLNNAYENVVNGNNNIYIGADVWEYLESAAVYEPAKSEVLTLAWEFDEYVISITIYDSSTKKDTGEIYPYVNGATYHTYFTREGWEYVLAGDYAGYGENVIDQIYPEGMVLPEK